MDHFLPFYPPPSPPPPQKKKPWKIRILEKWKNMFEISSSYTCAPKTKIIWGTVPLIWNERDRIFFNLCHFLPSHPLTNWKTKTLKKMKKASRDVIILHMCTKNHNHMYASWDMNCTRHNFLSFCTICCPFPPLTTWKIEISKKWEKKLEISSFYNCVPQITIIWCIVPKVWSMADRIFCHLGQVFVLLPPWQPKKS